MEDSPKIVEDRFQRKNYHFPVAVIAIVFSGRNVQISKCDYSG